MIILKLILLFLFLIILPLGVGWRMGEGSYIKSFLSGWVWIFALFLPEAVLLILLKAPLNLLALLFGLTWGLISFFGSWSHFRAGSETGGPLKAIKEAGVSFIKETGLRSMIPFVLVLLLFLYQGSKYLFLMHIDQDDARFTATAVDAVDNGSMYLINPATGEYKGAFSGELVKDVTSPWSMLFAVLSRLTLTHPAILMHTGMAVLLLLLTYLAVYRLGMDLTGQKRERAAWFTFFYGLVLMYFAGSTHTQGEFALVRIWQGKAAFAALMLPLYLSFSVRLFRKEGGTDLGDCRDLTVLNMASCLMSGIGLLNGGILTGTVMLVQVIRERRIRPLIRLLPAFIPALVLGSIQLLIR